MERNVISDINQLDGVGALNEQERSCIVEYIAKEKTTRITPLPKELPKRKRYAMQVPAKTRLARLVPSTLPCLNVMFANADQLTSSKKVELMKRIEKEKPLVIAICEIKPRNTKERDIQDYTITRLFHIPSQPRSK